MFSNLASLRVCKAVLKQQQVNLALQAFGALLDSMPGAHGVEPYKMYQMKISVVPVAANPRTRARVDSAMDWHHTNLRKGSATLVMNRVFAESLGRKKDAAAAQEAEDLLIASLKVAQALQGTAEQSILEISTNSSLQATKSESAHVSQVKS